AVHPRGHSVHAAVDVAGADHDRNLDPLVVHRGDLSRDGADALRVGAVVERAHQRLARELQQDAFEGRRHRTAEPIPRTPYWRTAKRAKRRITTFSPVLAVSSSRSCWTVLPSNFGLCISCSSRTTVCNQASSLPATMRSRTFAGLSAASCS